VRASKLYGMTSLTRQARPKIVVLDDYEEAFEPLANWQDVRSQADLTVMTQPVRGDALLALIRDADVLVLNRDRTPLKAELIALLAQLKLVIFTGARNQALDAAALAARGIPVCNTGWGPSKDSTAELTWALAMAAHKRLIENSAALHAGQWRTPHALLPVLKGETLGVIGLGEIGGRVAGFARAFGMHVQAWSPRMTHERAAAQGASFVDLDTLLATAKIVSLHLVVTPETQGLMNAERLARMRPDSILVNTSRSTLIHMADLRAALQQGRPGQAALDVFDQEPLPKDDPLHQIPHVLLTPHLGFVARPVYEIFVRDAHECVLAWLSGQALPRVICA
jgi:phosphoglycerate dehydrogenase-like enzyme